MKTEKAENGQQQQQIAENGCQNGGCRTGERQFALPAARECSIVAGVNVLERNFPGNSVAALCRRLLELIGRLANVAVLGSERFVM